MWAGSVLGYHYLIPLGTIPHSSSKAFIFGATNNGCDHRSDYTETRNSLNKKNETSLYAKFIIVNGFGGFLTIAILIGKYVLHVM